MNYVIWSLWMCSFILTFNTGKRQEPYQVKMATVKSLMRKLDAQDVAGVIGLLGTELNTALKSEETIEFDCSRVHALFQSYGIPREGVFQVRTKKLGPYKSIVVYVPICIGLDSATRLKRAWLEVDFGPDELYLQGKIFTYFLNQTFVLSDERPIN